MPATLVVSTSDHSHVYWVCTCFSNFLSRQRKSGKLNISLSFADMDDCLSEPCQNQGTCQDAVNSYSCSCVAGFSGRNCQTSMNSCWLHIYCCSLCFKCQRPCFVLLLCYVWYAVMQSMKFRRQKSLVTVQTVAATYRFPYSAVAYWIRTTALMHLTPVSALL